MRLEITGTGSELQGVGRAPDGRAAFVPFALPGETVEAEIVREKERFVEARLIRVLAPSPRRVQPDCPAYGNCGGCRARHMDYALSLELKQQKVANALTRIGGFDAPNVLPTLGMKSPLRMRNKAEYPIQGTKIGGYAGDSRHIVELSDCLLQTETSAALLRATRAWLQKNPATGLCHLVTRENKAGGAMAILCAPASAPELPSLAKRLSGAVPALQSVWFCRLAPKPAHALNGRCSLVWGAPDFSDELLGLTFTLSPQAFFQVNREQAETLFTAALDAAEPLEGARAFDAYCGAGAIALLMAARGARCLGVEIVPEAIRDAKENARRNGLSDRAEFLAEDAAMALPRLLKSGDVPDVITLDPPRKGADAALIDAIRAAKTPRVVYVSCDPATLARDAKRLCAGGAYRLEFARPVDMFPWTAHVECVVLMSRVEK